MPPAPPDAAVVSEVAPLDAGVTRVAPKPPQLPPVPQAHPHPPADAGVAASAHDPTASDIATLYTSVGRELQRAAASHSPDVTEALSIRFRRLRLRRRDGDAFEARQRARAELTELHRAITEPPP